MGIFRRSPRKRPRIDYKRWIDYERILEGGRAISSALSMFTIPRKKIASQSLEHAMERLHLTEKDIEDRKQVFLKLVFLMLGLAGCLFIYTIYLLYKQHLSGASVSTAIMFITLGLSFRYHFWYFQLKRRKLGCTFIEWLKIGIIGMTK